MLVQPAFGAAHPIEAQWQGYTLRFEVSFGKGLVALASREGAHVDLATGDVVWPGGRREDILGARALFRRFTGEAPPPWLFRLPSEPRAFVVPRGRLVIDGDLATGTLSLLPPPSCTPIFTCFYRADAVADAAYPPHAFAPMLQWPALRYSLGQGLSVLAPSEQDARLLEQTFASVCGARGRAWLHANKKRSVLVLVSPPGKHFSALPELRQMRDRLLSPRIDTDEHGVSVEAHAGFAAVTIVGEDTRYVCVTADDLRGDRASTKHELYHLLEAEMLASHERAWLDRWHARTVERGGPFARPYGFLRREFLPTLGELLAGSNAVADAWLRKNHRPLVQWLTGIVGEDKNAAITQT